ncbi:hypothetical protein [Pseudoalteromonas piscicida]|uniref:hypothetical protein n=1 Tax=Pseudoalteromonas piscicida TaxID=43662 RepID=UPI001C974494|nr:hypothetical protein [Pseudoalteromonas piscicida]QZO15149.1 hypothetical protein K5642_23090 [Pseudoalteromonas piscicida]
MNLEFKELSKSRSAKLRKVILLNSVLLPATVLGFVYLPDLLQANINGAGKLMAAVGMGPVIALVYSIIIGVAEQQFVRFDNQGITFGGPVSGETFCNWLGVRELTLSDDQTALHVQSSGLNTTVMFPLKKYGISLYDYQQIQMFRFRHSY